MTMLDRDALDGLFHDAPGIGVAMTRLRDALAAPTRLELFYGYVVQEDDLQRDKFVCGISRLDAALKLFHLAGGPKNDPIAREARDWTEPRAFDLRRHARAHEAHDAKRMLFNLALHRLGVRTVWVAPLRGPEVRGYGVLNQLHSAEDARSVVPEAELMAFAVRVHEALRRSGVLRRELRLTADEAEVARDIASGLSAAAISERRGVTRRTVERRLASLRRRLGARSTAEAIYKATAYGVL